MREKTTGLEPAETGAIASPIDIEKIWHTARDVPPFRSIPDAKAYGAILLGHLQLLIPEAEAAISRRNEQRGDLEGRGRVLAWCRMQVERRYGNTLALASWQVENLATACRLLLSMVASPNDLPRLCSWCQAYTAGTRLIRVFETGSGPSASLYACRSCRVECALIPVGDGR